MQYVILAAGRGERFRSVGYDLPKALLPIPERRGGHSSLLSSALRFIDRLVGHNDTVHVAMSPEVAGLVRSAHGSLNYPHQHLVVSNSRSPVETGLALTLSQLNPDEPVVFLDCDSLYGFDMRIGLQQFLDSTRDAGTFIVPSRNLAAHTCHGKFSGFDTTSNNDNTATLIEGASPDKFRNGYQPNIGVYVFRTANVFRDLAVQAMDEAQCAVDEGLPYKEPTIPSMIKLGLPAVYILNADIMRSSSAYTSPLRFQSMPLSTGAFVDGYPYSFVVWRPIGSPDEYEAYRARHEQFNGSQSQSQEQDN